jgi:hypothetical protein
VKKQFDEAYPSSGAPHVVTFHKPSRMVCVSVCDLGVTRGGLGAATGKATEGVFHCVCGRSFAAACTYEQKQSIWLSVTCPDAVISVLLWRSKDNPYD